MYWRVLSTTGRNWVVPGALVIWPFQPRKYGHCLSGKDMRPS